ncbi:unnamed protein product [Vitrella brassicaformis CCMP3155]|uniref:ADP-ribosylation factor n=1 Tax=Vitrella brassicaformis (strain CCMP3155) TaxID=1169540 RepID=A0A0G4ERY9_VITBC|nr:unnamed protein product [Vitrella brassicaformis CCMP3155]|eukprot:CEM00003.1 unnamed protein product [Vitrella brassicaformis CCMP3155]
MGNCVPGGDHLHQILILGLSGSGKTTLLYKLKIPGWAEQDIAQKIPTPTKGYHYEEFNKRGMRFGMWDVPGADAMQALWPAFYRYIKVSAVIFVVSMVEMNPKKIRQAGEHIRILVHEDELREAAFCVLMNTFGRPMMPGAGQHSTVAFQSTLSLSQAPASLAVGQPVPTIEEMAAKLGLHNLPRSVQMRLKCFAMDVKKGDGDEEWPKALAWLQERIFAIQKQAQAAD